MDNIAIEITAEDLAKSILRSKGWILDPAAKVAMPPARDWKTEMRQMQAEARFLREKQAAANEELAEAHKKVVEEEARLEAQKPRQIPGGMSTDPDFLAERQAAAVRKQQEALFGHLRKPPAGAVLIGYSVLWRNKPDFRGLDEWATAEGKRASGKDRALFLDQKKAEELASRHRELDGSHELAVVEPIYQQVLGEIVP